MMTRDEIQRMPCWSCWWREGARCYSQSIYRTNVDLYGVPLDDGLVRFGASVEIHPRLPIPLVEADDEKPCMDYLNKRDMLSRYFINEQIVIVSEAAR